MKIFYHIFALLFLSLCNAADSSSNSSNHSLTIHELCKKFETLYTSSNWPSGFTFPAGKYENHLVYKGVGRAIYHYTVNKKLPNEHHFAVKVFSEVPPDALGGTWHELAWLEISILRVVDHPNIMSFFGAYYKDEKIWMWTEYFPKGTLDDYVPGRPKAGSLALPYLKNIFKDVLKALAYLHSYGMIHRDIKPANIAVSGAGAKLIDFGLCTPPTTNKGFIHTDRTCTLFYVAPEVFHEKPYNHLVDIYSFGITVWTMFGDPFPGSPMVDNPSPDLECIKVHFATLKNMEVVWGLLDVIPEMFRAAIMSAVNYDPEQRPNALSIIDMLDNPDEYSHLLEDEH